MKRKMVSIITALIITIMAVAIPMPINSLAKNEEVLESKPENVTEEFGQSNISELNTVVLGEEYKGTVIYGDVDNDGDVDEDDCTYFKDIYFGGNFNPDERTRLACDLICDGEINIYDVQRLVEYVYQQIPLENIASGYCGDNATWVLTASGELVISGEGDMWEWTYTSHSPWYDYTETISTVIINDGITSIGGFAFHDCSNLLNITISNNVVYIGSGAFFNCDSLKKIDVPIGVARINNDTFYNCSNLISVSLPNTVNSIGDSAFYGCESMTYIQIPESVTSIGDENAVISSGSFARCKNLKSINIPNGVKRIREGTFAYCENLENVHIPGTVTSIGMEAFWRCDNLKQIYYHGSQLEWATIDISSIGNSFLWDNQNINYDSLSATSGRCGDEVSWQLEDFTLYITGIGDMWNWSSEKNAPWYDYYRVINNVIIDNGVTSIGDYAFYQCSIFTAIDMPQSITSIGDHSFCGCANLISVVIPEGVSKIHDSTFSGCQNLTSIIIPETVVSIGNNAFFYCSSLQEITIPNSVQIIGEEAFRDCGTLSKITLSNAMTSISESMFYHCFNLNNVVIPNSITNIDAGAFAYCDDLTNVTIPDSVTTIGNSAFDSCGLTNITIPNSVTRIDAWTFSSCTDLTSITIPDSITSIGAYAFSTCTSLSDVYYIGAESEWNSVTIDSGNDFLTNANIHFVSNHTVTYDYSTNGGTSATAASVNVADGAAADLSPTATKAGWEFVGWNTNPNATTALSSYTVTGNVTLYAIYKKTLTVNFYSRGNSLQTTKTATIYNNSTRGNVTAPSPSSYSGWTALGWRDDTSAAVNEYGKTDTISISNNMNFYAVYSRTLTLSYNANGGGSTPPSQTATQYYNASGKKEGKTFTLASAITRNGYSFNGWAENTTSGTVYTANRSITITDPTVMYAIWQATTNPPPAKTFTMIRDNYSFANTWSSFGYGKSYRIPLERYISVFGITLGAQKYNTAGYWGGSCYGFAATSSLFFDELLDYTRYDDSAEDLYSIDAPRRPSANLTILIERYQIAQSLNSVLRERSKYYEDYNSLIAAVEHFENTGEDPVILCVQRDGGGHAVVPYKCEQNVNGSYSIYVYDNNYPSDRERIVTINRNLNGFSYDRYNKSMAFNYADTVYNALEGISLMSNDDTATVTLNSDNISFTDVNGIDISNIDGAFEVLPIEEDYDTSLKTYIVPIGDYIIKNNRADINKFEVSIANELDYQLVTTDDLNASISVGISGNTGRVYAYVNSTENSKNCIQMINNLGVSKRLESVGKSLGISAESNNSASIISDSFVNCNGVSLALGSSGNIESTTISTDTEMQDGNTDDICSLIISTNTLKYANQSINGKISFVAYNNTDSIMSAEITACLYSKDGRLVSIIDTQDTILGIGSNYVNFDSINYTNLEDDEYYIKCFIWDSLDGMKALGDAVKVDIA